MIKMDSVSERRESASIEIPTGGLPNRRALKEFLDSHEYSLELNGATEARKAGKTLVFLFYDQEAYGDRSYYFCEEDNKVYSDYFSIGD